MEAKDTVMTTKQTAECSHNPVLELRLRGICEAQAEISFKAGEKQARWNVGGELCGLIGNLMLEDTEAGILLGHQLEEYMKRCLKEWGV